MYLWSYAITWIDDGNDYKESELNGLLVAANWAEAVEHLVENYGEDNLYKINKLYAISDSTACYELPSEILAQVEEHIDEIF